MSAYDLLMLAVMAGRCFVRPVERVGLASCFVSGSTRKLFRGDAVSRHGGGVYQY